ncbi:glycosyltransferase, partial [Staphylococcus xylosus]
MKHIFLVIFDLNIKKGGKTTSLLTRAKIFNDYGIETDIVTFDYKSNYGENTNELRKINKLDSKTKVHNQFYFFEEKSLAQLKSDDNINELCQKIVRDNISIKKNENEFEIFSYKTGEHIAHIKYKNN